MDTGILAALIGTIGGIVITIAGLVGANKAGIGKTQEKLVASLKDLVDIQTKKIDTLETSIGDANIKIDKLQSRVKELETLTISQATEIDNLRRKRPLAKLGMED